MSALDDIIIIIEWLAATKTPTAVIAEAIARLKSRKIPLDVKMETFPADRHDADKQNYEI